MSVNDLKVAPRCYIIESNKYVYYEREKDRIEE